MNLRLAQKNREVDPESWDYLYGKLVSAEFRKRYSADKVEAIINNYLDNQFNPIYVEEFQAMQLYRKECKQKIREMMEIQEKAP